MKASSSCLALLCLAMSLHAAHGQVGFVNLTVTNGYNFLSNPFNTYDTNGVLNNSITNVLPPGNASPTIPPGAAVYLWNTASQAFTPPSTFSSATGWSVSYDLPPGKGFALYSPSSWSITIVGSVVSGTSTSILPGTNQFALVASKVAIVGDLSPSGLALPATDGETLFLHRPDLQKFSDAFTWFAGWNWFDPNALAGTNGPTIGVGQAFFVQHPGPDLNWVQTYTPHATQAGQKLSTTYTEPTLSNLRLKNATVSVDVANAAGSPYSIAFSADGRLWTIVATNQTATVWTGPYPGGLSVYYRVSSP